MAIVERMREALSSLPTESYLRGRTEEGWRLVAVEWEREVERAEAEAAWLREEAPYGLRVADDCTHLQKNPAEMQALELMLDLIAIDKSLSEVADELNHQGFRSRRGSKWTQTAVFNMLPRLIEAAPQIRGVQPSSAR